MQRAESVGRAAADPFWVPRLPPSGEAPAHCAHDL